MLGTWKGDDYAHASQISSKTIVIDSTYGNVFKGYKATEADDRNRSKIVTELAGRIELSSVYIQNGKVLFKRDPPGGKWKDCGICPATGTMNIADNKLILTISISGCDKGCNGVSTYFKPLCEFDSTTQLLLVQRFGTQDDIAGFTPCKDLPPIQENKDSVNKAILIAKQKQQDFDDSVKHAQNIAKVQQKRTEDSLRNAENVAKLRQKQFEDSVAKAESLAKLKLQRTQDSVKAADDLAERKQQQLIADSIRIQTELAGKRKQQLQDSINTATALQKKQQQQLYDDSVKNAQNLARIKQQQDEDSIKNVQAVAKANKQRLEDSVKNAARLAKIKQQQTADSIKNANLLAKKRQQQTEDSLKNAAALAKRNPPPTDDADLVSSNPKRDSIRLVNTNKAFTTRENVLLESYHITTPDILIELFDNAQIDGDRVSVFHNGTIVVNNKTLLKEPITFTIHADSANRTHEFVMVAENLGSLPPNTALMRITVGTQRYSLGVKTDLSTNAKIVFYYDGK